MAGDPPPAPGGREPWHCGRCGFSRVDDQAEHQKKHDYDTKQKNDAIAKTKQKNLKKNKGSQLAKSKGKNKPSKSGKRNNVCN